MLPLSLVIQLLAYGSTIQARSLRDTASNSFEKVITGLRLNPSTNPQIKYCDTRGLEPVVCNNGLFSEEEPRMFYAARQAAAICAARSDVRSSEVNALMEWLNVDPVNMMMYTSATGPPGAAGKWTTGVVGAVIESAKIDLSIKLFLEVDIHIPIGDDGYINLSGGPNTALKLEIDPRQAIRDVLTTLKEVLIPEVTKAGEQVDQAEKGVSEGGAEGGSGRGSEGDGDSGSGSAGGGGDDSSEPEPSEPEPSEPEPPTDDPSTPPPESTERPQLDADERTALQSCLEKEEKMVMDLIGTMDIDGEEIRETDEEKHERALRMLQQGICDPKASGRQFCASYKRTLTITISPDTRLEDVNKPTPLDPILGMRCEPSLDSTIPTLCQRMIQDVNKRYVVDEVGEQILSVFDPKSKKKVNDPRLFGPINVKQVEVAVKENKGLAGPKAIFSPRSPTEPKPNPNPAPGAGAMSPPHVPPHDFPPSGSNALNVDGMVPLEQLDAILLIGGYKGLPKPPGWKVDIPWLPTRSPSIPKAPAGKYDDPNLARFEQAKRIFASKPKGWDEASWRTLLKRLEEAGLNEQSGESSARDEL